tara:strand:+ start:37 stop:492 length:456 start_codon:yes stop_codon:yes gene_type:complete
LQPVTIYLSAIPLNYQGKIKMKTSELLQTIDEAQKVYTLWQEKREANYITIQNVKKEYEEKLEALRQEVKTIENEGQWQLFAGEMNWNAAAKAFEKAMAFFKTVDDNKVERTIRQFEQGIITQYEMMHDLQRLTIEEAYVGQGQRLAETNW